MRLRPHKKRVARGRYHGVSRPGLFLKASAATDRSLRTTLGAGNDSDKLLCESNTVLLRHGAVIRMVARHREVRPMKGAARMHGAGVGHGCGPSAAQSASQIGH